MTCPEATITIQARADSSSNSVESRFWKYLEGRTDNVYEGLHIRERERSCYGLNCVPSESHVQDFPDGPVAKNLPCNAEDVSLIPGLGTKVPHTSTAEPICHS